MKEFSDTLISFRKEAKNGNDDDIHLPNFEINIPFEINNFMKIKKYFEEEQLYSLFGLFSGCSSLKELPDISKWNAKKANNFGSLFDGCSSLIKLPDISKWDTSNAKFFHKFLIIVHY